MEIKKVPFFVTSAPAAGYRYTIGTTNIMQLPVGMITRLYGNATVYMAGRADYCLMFSSAPGAAYTDLGTILYFPDANNNLLVGIGTGSGVNAPTPSSGFPPGLKIVSGMLVFDGFIAHPGMWISMVQGGSNGTANQYWNLVTQSQVA